MDLLVKMRMLQLAVKLQEAMHELYRLINEDSTVSEGLDSSKVGEADYRIAPLTAHLIAFAAN